MKTTKDVIEAAIKVRQDEWDKLEYKERQLVKSHRFNPDQHIFILSDMDNIAAQITELKQSLQIIYDNQKPK